MYQTPFNLPSGCYLIEATSEEARTVVILSVGADQIQTTQQILLQVPGPDGEQIQLLHVGRGNGLSGLRVLRHNPMGGDHLPEVRDVKVACTSVQSLVSEMLDLRAELDELKTKVFATM